MMELEVDIPTLRAELDRKTTETLVSAVERYQAAEVTALECVAVLDTLWGMAAGLVSRATMDLIAETRDELARSVGYRKRHFRKGAVILSLEACPRDTRLLMVKNPGTAGATIEVHNFDTDRERAAAIKQLARGLVCNEDWVEI